MNVRLEIPGRQLDSSSGGGGDRRVFVSVEPTSDAPGWTIRAESPYYDGSGWETIAALTFTNAETSWILNQIGAETAEVMEGETIDVSTFGRPSRVIPAPSCLDAVRGLLDDGFGISTVDYLREAADRLGEDAGRRRLLIVADRLERGR